MLLSLIASLALLLLGACAKLLTRDWLHPAPVFCLFWAGTCLLCIICAPENITSSSGTLWIALNAVFVTTGGVLGTALASSRASQKPVEQGPPSPAFSSVGVLSTHLRVCTLLGLLFVPLCLRSQGIGLGQLASLRGIAKIAIQMSLMRYANTSQAIPDYVEVLLAASYLAPLLGGTLFVRRRRLSDTWLALLSLLPCVGAFAVQSTKSSVLYGVTLWISGYLATRPYHGVRTCQLRLRTVGLIALGVPLVVVFLLLGETLRGGRANLPGSGFLLSGRMKTQLAGHLPALSQWMDTHDVAELDPTLGRYTFAGLYQYVVPASRVNGLYGESVILPTGVTNVYTYFRELIEDYTRPGALLIMLILAASGGYAYRRVLEGAAGWVGLLAACYAGTLFGLSSIFNYNSIVLALFLYSAWWMARGHSPATALVPRHPFKNAVRSLGHSRPQRA